ncbi:hypothetical protein INR49_015666 [Caranx melampygus]|nr:hypothetical protein INR49_015666 [Caranx melampygus]
METNCPHVHFLLNSDHDVFAHTDNMVHYLQSLKDNDGSKHLFTGDLIVNAGPIRDPQSKYYIPVQAQESNRFPSYCGGGGFLLSLQPQPYTKCPEELTLTSQTDIIPTVEVEAVSCLATQPQPYTKCPGQMPFIPFMMFTWECAWLKQASVLKVMLFPWHADDPVELAASVMRSSSLRSLYVAADVNSALASALLSSAALASSALLRSDSRRSASSCARFLSCSSSRAFCVCSSSSVHTRIHTQQICAAQLASVTVHCYLLVSPGRGREREGGRPGPARPWED